MQFIPNEKTVTQRQPSIANLMVDSADRNTTAYPLCNDFQISKRNSLLNGFFTRIGATEIVFEWNTENITSNQNRYVITTNEGSVTSSIAAGFYTQAGLLDTFVAAVNEAALGYTFTVNAVNGGGATIEFAATTGTNFTLSGSLVDLIFGSSPITNLSPVWVGGATLIPFIDLRPVRYIDIVCNQLTNNQSVKDASTAPIVRDVLCRWYFDYDNQTPTDTYGYPILMGYTPFFLRRLYNPPKQIQWQTNVPIGNLSFQLYGNDGNILPVQDSTNYLMTLQVSEN